MDLSQEIQKLKSEPNQETYEKLLLETKSNSSLYLEVLFDYVNFLTLKKNYTLIIKSLELPIEEDFIEDRVERLSIVNKLVGILLKVEDFLKLKQTLDNRQELISKESDLLMQQFYYAVCYEGLNETSNAIEVLENIKDNISNQNLVNKYLKLSMLYLKLNNFEKAKEYFNTAGIYDKDKKNPTFLLAECDLLMFQKNYLKALEVYENYFIKTKNKYRYLDRYINIQIALNQLAEGYSFYEKHLSIMQRVLSRQSRLVFYRSALNLMKKLKNHQQEAYLENLIVEIEDSYEPLNNVYDYLLKMIKNNYDKPFLKPRDIIHSLYSETALTGLFSKMVYVKLEDGLIKLMHYTKGLLLEKTFDVAIDSLNVYQDLKSQEYLEVYDQELLSKFNNDPFLSKKDKFIFVNEVKSFEYMVFYLDHDDFYKSKKYFDLTALLVKKLLNDFLKTGFNDSLLKNLLAIFDVEENGVFLLKENNLFLLNKAAKDLLDFDSDYMSIEDFQGRLIKNIYVDELVKNNHITLKYQSQGIKEIDFKIFRDELDIYLLGKKTKNKVEIRKYHDYRYIKEELIDDDNSILFFSIRNYQEFMKDYSYSRYESLLNKIYDTLRLTSRNYYQNLYLEGRDNLYLILSTKDKRIIKRIYEEIFSLCANEVDIRASLLYLKTEITNNDLEDLQYLNALTTKEERFIQDNKAYRTNREIAKTILLNVQKILEENHIKLSYQLVVDYQTNIYKFIYVDVLNRVLLGNRESLSRVIRANELESDWDDLLLSTLVKEVRLANFQGKFLVEVSLKTLIDSQRFTKMIKKINNKSFNQSEIVFVVDYQEFKETEFKGVKGFKLAFKNLVSNFKLTDIKDLNLIDYLILNNEEVNDSSYDYFLKILKDSDVEIVFDHGKSSLTKSFLESKDLLMVMGEAFGKFDNLSNIRKLEAK